MTTLAEMRVRCRVAISDSNGATWADSIVDDWIRAGIADYAAHFFDRASVDVVAVPGQRSYTMDDAVSILSVEYPAGNDPPTFLQFKGFTGGNGFEGDGVYVFLRDVSGGGTLWLGFDPGSETIRVRYELSHDSELAAGDTAVLTVPDDHLYVVELFVQWASVRNLMSKEHKAPTNDNSLLMSQYSTNAYRLERAYSMALRRLLYSANVDSGPVAWALPDSVGRIY